MNYRLMGEFKDLRTIINFQIEKFSDLHELEEKIENDKANTLAIQGLYVYFLEKWMSIFPKEQFCILSLEDLASNPRNIMKQVFDFLGVPNYEIEAFTNKNPGNYPEVGDEIRQKLYEFYRPHNQRLEEFLGRKFNWDITELNSDGIPTIATTPDSTIN